MCRSMYKRGVCCWCVTAAFLQPISPTICGDMRLISCSAAVPSAAHTQRCAAACVGCPLTQRHTVLHTHYIPLCDFTLPHRYTARLCVLRAIADAPVDLLQLSPRHSFSHTPLPRLTPHTAHTCSIMKLLLLLLALTAFTASYASTQRSIPLFAWSPQRYAHITQSSAAVHSSSVSRYC